MTIEELDIKKLSLLENNPRRISKEQMKKLCDSLEGDPGFLSKRPILVNRVDGKLSVYAGNQRVRAAKKLKWKKVPCIVEDNLDKELVKSRVIKDNQTYGEFDYDILANEWDTELLIDAGMTEEQLSFDPIEVIDSDGENDVLEPKDDKEATTKPGDIYELNGHRLICGDSTHPEVVDKLLDVKEDDLPVLMVTDPPYGVEYDPSWRQKAGKGTRATGTVQNDDKINWALAWHLFPGSVAYV